VVAAAEGRLESFGTSLSPSLQDEILIENEWLVARDGLNASLIAPESAAGTVPVRLAIADLLQRVGPVAETFGDGEAVAGVAQILQTGNGADRMRAEFASTNDLRAVVDWLVEETRVGTGIDRRREGRDHAVATPTSRGGS